MSTQTIWDLVDEGEVEAIRAVCPDGFNWRSLHPKSKATPLQLLVFECAIQCTDADKVNKYLKLATWMIQQGADPTHEAPKSCSQEYSLWKVDHEEDTKVKLRFAELSAISLTLRLRRELQDAMKTKTSDGYTPNWKMAVEKLSKLLDVFCSGPLARREFVSVDATVVDLWERIRHESGTHDVVLVTGDETDDVPAHSVVLRAASPVLSTMLTLKMREGVTKKIPVDCGADSVNFLLDLLYSGTSSVEPTAPQALAAFQLASRWQLQGAASMLAQALQGLISDESFVDIAECALLQGHTALRDSCALFGEASASVKAKAEAGTLPASVLELLGKNKRPQKRRRTF